MSTKKAAKTARTAKRSTKAAAQDTIARKDDRKGDRRKEDPGRKVALASKPPKTAKLAKTAAAQNLKQKTAGAGPRTSPPEQAPPAAARASKVTKTSAATSGKKAAKRAASAPAAAKLAAGPRPSRSRRSTARRHSELTPRIIARLRQALLDKHRDLVGAVRSSKGDSREQTTDGTEDYIDYAVSSYDREFLLSLTELEQRELRRVEEALRRMDRGEYGFCQASGEEIPLKRLEAQPWARYSLRIQELEDQGLLEQEEFESSEPDEEMLEEPDYEELEEEEEEEEEQEDELEYRDEIPGDDNLNDPDTEERVV
jgi:DnaK suppressor protein